MPEKFLTIPTSSLDGNNLPNSLTGAVLSATTSVTGLTNGTAYRTFVLQNPSPSFTPVVPVSNAITRTGAAFETNFVGATTDDLTVNLGATAPAMLVLLIPLAGGGDEITSIRLDPAGANLAPTATFALTGNIAGDSAGRMIAMARFNSPGLSGNQVVRINTLTNINRWGVEAFSVTGWTTMGTPAYLPVSASTDPYNLNITTTSGRGLLFGAIGGVMTVSLTAGDLTQTENFDGVAYRYVSGADQSTSTGTTTITADWQFSTTGGAIAVEFS